MSKQPSNQASNQPRNPATKQSINQSTQHPINAATNQLSFFCCSFSSLLVALFCSRMDLAMLESERSQGVSKCGTGMIMVQAWFITGEIHNPQATDHCNGPITLQQLFRLADHSLLQQPTSGKLGGIAMPVLDKPKGNSQHHYNILQLSINR